MEELTQMTEFAYAKYEKYAKDRPDGYMKGRIYYNDNVWKELNIDIEEVKKYKRWIHFGNFSGTIDSYKEEEEYYIDLLHKYVKEMKDNVEKNHYTDVYHVRGYAKTGDISFLHAIHFYPDSEDALGWWNRTSHRTCDVCKDIEKKERKKAVLNKINDTGSGAQKKAAKFQKQKMMVPYGKKEWNEAAMKAVELPENEKKDEENASNGCNGGNSGNDEHDPYCYCFDCKIKEHWKLTRATN